MRLATYVEVFESKKVLVIRKIKMLRICFFRLRIDSKSVRNTSHKTAWRIN